MTDASPAPGTLEHLASLRPDEVALLEGDRSRTRAAWERRANALALALEDVHGVGPGTRVRVSLAPSLELHELTFALAKLGATPVAVPPGATLPPHAGVLDPDLRPGAAWESLVERHEDGPARLTGTRPPAPTVTWDDAAQVLHVRTLTPARAAGLGGTVADLLDRLALRPNAVHLMAAPVHLPAATFHANVALVGGGAVVCQPDFDPAAWLALAEARAVTTALVTPAMLAALTALPEASRDAADLTALETIVVAGVLDDDARAAAADLLGEDVVHEVHGTARAGDLALRGPSDAALRPLRGVSLGETADGRLTVRSPLAADPSPDEPVDAGPGRLGAGGTLELS